jgi:hypothetical protein
MARTDDDTWDINESVGATALGVAGGRAAETNSADPLINDPYARLFLEAAGDGIWKIYLDDEPPPELAEVDPRFKERIQGGDELHGVADEVLRRLLPGCRSQRHPPSGDIGGWARRPRLALGVAGGQCGLRD